MPGVIPGQPEMRFLPDLPGVLEQGDEIFHRVGFGFDGGFDQAHQDRSNVGSVLGLEEVTILSVEDGEFERLF